MRSNYPVDGHEIEKTREASPEYLREVLRRIVEISTLLSPQIDPHTMLKQIVEAYSQTFSLPSALLCLVDETDFVRVVTTTGLDAEEEAYLCQYALPVSHVARIVEQCYRISSSYFLPAKSAIWRDEESASSFVQVKSSPDLAEASLYASFSPSSDNSWSGENIILVPLMNVDNNLLGFLIHSHIFNSLRPAGEEMALFELFAQQAAAVIKSATFSRELREIVRQARESEHAKNDFLLLASHELRTPLTAVQGYLELLGDYGETLDEGSRVRFTQNARRSCDELVLLLSNVLDLTHLDGEKITLHLSPTYLLRSTQLILSILEPIIGREKRVVDLHIPGDVCVWADEIRLRQVLLNVLGNALKYTPADSRIAISSENVEMFYLSGRGLVEKPEGPFSSTSSGTFIILTIQDWGPGIVPEKQPLLFTKFTRLESARKSPQQGAGLGLYLCRQLIEAMHGSIWLKSSGIPGEGAAFCIALPVYKV